MVEGLATKKKKGGNGKHLCAKEFFRLVQSARKVFLWKSGNCVGEYMRTNVTSGYAQTHSVNEAGRVQRPAATNRRRSVHVSARHGGVRRRAINRGEPCC